MPVRRRGVAAAPAVDCYSSSRSAPAIRAVARATNRASADVNGWVLRGWPGRPWPVPASLRSRLTATPSRKRDCCTCRRGSLCNCTCGATSSPKVVKAPASVTGKTTRVPADRVVAGALFKHVPGGGLVELLAGADLQRSIVGVEVDAVDVRLQRLCQLCSGQIIDHRGAQCTVGIEREADASEGGRVAGRSCALRRKCPELERRHRRHAAAPRSVAPAPGPQQRRGRWRRRGLGGCAWSCRAASLGGCARLAPDHCCSDLPARTLGPTDRAKGLFHRRRSPPARHQAPPGPSAVRP